jgi:hypothetical protein
MARVAAEDCMFCGTVHAGQCGGKPKPPKVKRVVKATPSSTEVPSSVAPPPTVEAVGKVGSSEGGATSEPAPAPSPTERARPNLSTVSRVREDAVFGPAITLFAERDMLGHEDLTRFRPIIELPDYRIDAMIWKQVNNESVQRRR